MKNKLPHLTFLLMLICIVVSLISNSGKSRDVLSYLFIVNPNHSVFDSFAIHWWRLITPIFIHFGFPHLLFNMMCLYDFGAHVEKKHGSLFFGCFVAVVAIISNLAQYKIAHSPVFGGMSGVGYGLFGYVWIYTRSIPSFGYQMSQISVLIMLVWFVLCWTGLFGNVANWVHAAGLFVGMLIAYIHIFGSKNNEKAATLNRDQKEASSSSLH